MSDYIFNANDWEKTILTEAMLQEIREELDPDFVNVTGDTMEALNCTTVNANTGIYTPALDIGTEITFPDGTKQNTAYSSGALSIIQSTVESLNTTITGINSTIIDMSYNSVLLKTIIGNNCLINNLTCNNINTNHLNDTSGNLQSQITNLQNTFISSDYPTVNESLVALRNDLSGNVYNFALSSDLTNISNTVNNFKSDVSGNIYDYVQKSDLSGNIYNYALNSDLNQLKVDLSGNVYNYALNSDLTTTNQNIDNLKIDLSGNVYNYALNSDLTTTNENIDNLKIDLSGNVYNYALNSDLTTTNNNLQSQINSANTNIATNTSNIATNTSNIATNTSNIATNTSNIATNTSNIASNTNNISTLTTKTQNITSSALSNTSITGSVNVSSNVSCNTLTVASSDINTLIDGAKPYTMISIFDNNELLNLNTSTLAPTTTYNNSYSYSSLNFITSSSKFFNSDGTLKVGKYYTTLSYALTDFVSMKQVLVRYLIVRQLKTSPLTINYSYISLRDGFEETSSFQYKNYGGQTTGVFTIPSSTTHDYYLIIQVECDIYTNGLFVNGVSGTSKFTGHLILTEVF
jgi:hypothetical protein